MAPRPSLEPRPVFANLWKRTGAPIGVWTRAAGRRNYSSFRVLVIISRTDVVDAQIERFWHPWTFKRKPAPFFKKTKQTNTSLVQNTLAKEEENPFFFHQLSKKTLAFLQSIDKNVAYFIFELWWCNVPPSCITEVTFSSLLIWRT